jgi:phosphohistidine phosphatase
MKQLWILRHAKSSWADVHLDDLNRPLNDRGWKSARLIGRELKRRNIHFDLVLASPAARVRETIDGLREELELNAEIRFEAMLYLATSEALMQTVRQIPETFRAPLLIGHNPGLQQFILELTGADRQGLRDRVVQKLPTAAFVQIDLPANHWSEVTADKGQIANLILARELALGPLERDRSVR